MNMSFEQWFAVLTLVTPLVGQLVVTLMIRRDLNHVLSDLEKHEKRLDAHALVLVRAAPDHVDAVAVMTKVKP